MKNKMLRLEKKFLMANFVPKSFFFFFFFCYNKLEIVELNPKNIK